MMQNRLFVHEKIHSWYQKNGRVDLPWRQTTNPYHIYISEVMLQQTQVITVLNRYYFPFLKRFPTLEILGNSSLDEVLKLWEGLGYYNRAKNLHRTAGLVRKLPSEVDELMKLPGIGKNTAHAVATFAFKKPVPIMEANVKRILCRIYRFKRPKEVKLWEVAHTLLDKSNPFDYNQAMMDIGATVCKPKNPYCEICPLSSICKGKENPTFYPSKKKRIVPTRQQNIILYIYRNKVSLMQRKGKFLHGLWGFDDIVSPPSTSFCIGEVTQTYTHFKLSSKVYVYKEVSATQDHYFSIDEIDKLAISKVDDKILNLYLGTIQRY